MPVALYLAFVGATLVLLVIPGPNGAAVGLAFARK
jgi:threonine/homoserine/homoserine lactone efflux protein